MITVKKYITQLKIGSVTVVLVYVYFKLSAQLGCLILFTHIIHSFQSSSSEPVLSFSGSHGCRSLSSSAKAGYILGQVSGLSHISSVILKWNLLLAPIFRHRQQGILRVTSCFTFFSSKLKEKTTFQWWLGKVKAVLCPSYYTNSSVICVETCYFAVEDRIFHSLRLF